MDCKMYIVHFYVKSITAAQKTIFVQMLDSMIKVHKYVIF